MRASGLLWSHGPHSVMTMFCLPRSSGRAPTGFLAPNATYLGIAYIGELPVVARVTPAVTSVSLVTLVSLLFRKELLRTLDVSLLRSRSCRPMASPVKVLSAIRLPVTPLSLTATPGKGLPSSSHQR